MKRKLFSLGALLCVAMVSLGGCDEDIGVEDECGEGDTCAEVVPGTEDEHTHVYDQKVEDDKYLASAADCTHAATYYLSCTCGEKGSETFTVGDPLGHTPGEYVIDGESHYQICSVCGEAATEAVAHTFDQEVASEEYLLSAANCTTASVYYKSCICGAKGSETFAYGEALGHVYEGYEHDEAQHWQKCVVCEGTTEKVNHTYDQEVVSEEYLASAANCTTATTYYKSCICGVASTTETFTDGEPLGHDYTDVEYSSDANGHWKVCTRCGEPSTSENHEMVSAGEAYFGEYCSICGYVSESTLSAVTNIAYENRVITFTGVDDALSYELVITQDEETIVSETLTEASYTVPEDLAGHYNVSVTAVHGTTKSVATTQDVTIGYLDTDTRIEAEDCVLRTDRTASLSSCSGGKYACNFDNAGEGMYVRYYAYAEGERNLTIAYATANSSGASMKIFVNDAQLESDGGSTHTDDEYNFTPVYFNEVKGWYGTTTTSSFVTVQIELEQGWNDIYVMKHNFGSDTEVPGGQYGGFVQIDYFEFEGDEKEYSYDETDKTQSTYRLESECGNYVYSGSTVPTSYVKYGDSCGYVLASVAAGFSVTFTFEVKQTGTYHIQHCFARASTEITVPTNVYVNDEKLMDGASQGFHLDELSGSNTYYSRLSTNYVEATLTAGQTTTIKIEFSSDNSLSGTTNNWFVSDYVLVSLAA